MHPDFERILYTFNNHFKDGSGFDRFQKFIDQNRLDIAKPYGRSQLHESFQWLEPEIQFLKQDKDAKYYKVVALTANVSMNLNDYSNYRKLITSAPSLTVKPINLNHDHGKWQPFPRTRVDLTGAEDMSVETLVRVDNADAYLQKQLDHDASVPESEWICHPSIEGYRGEDGEIEFTGLALLEKGAELPGDPLTEIVPLILNESVRNQICKVVDGKVQCEPCQTVDPPQNREVITISKIDEAEKPYPNIDQFADPENRKYPIDCPHVMAAWSYINMPKNQGEYSAEKWASMNSRVKAAMKRCGHQVSDEETMMDERDTKILRLSETNLKLQEDGNKTRTNLIEAQTTLSEKNRLLAEKERRIIELEGLETLVKLRDGKIQEQEQELLTSRKKYEVKVNEVAAVEKQYIERAAAKEKTWVEERTVKETERIEEKNTILVQYTSDMKNIEEKWAAKEKLLGEKIQALTKESEASRKAAKESEASMITQHETEKKSLVDHVAVLTKTVETKEVDFKQVMENNTRLQGQNDGLRKDVQLFSTKASEANESTRKAKQELIEIQTQNAGLMDENARITDKNNELTKQFTSKVKEYYINSQENEKLTERIRQLEEGVASMRIQAKKMNKVLTEAGYAWIDGEGNLTKQS